MADEPGGVFRGDGGLDGDAAAICRVVEGKAPGVEHESAGFCFLALGVGVDGVANEGVTQVEHVYAYLVGTPGVQGTHDE